MRSTSRIDRPTRVVARGESRQSVEDLTFTYPGATTAAVDGMSFSVTQGEVFGLLGPSGAGKTTAQRILIGLLVGWTGRVALDGRDLRD